eukprot:5789757-Karenia_brevis.AAC.1
MDKGKPIPHTTYPDLCGEPPPQAPSTGSGAGRSGRGSRGPSRDGKGYRAHSAPPITGQQASQYE